MKKQGLDTTAEFKIKRSRGKKLRVWQKLLVGTGIAILVIVLIAICVFYWFKNGFTPEQKDGLFKNNSSAETIFYSKNEDGEFVEDANGKYKKVYIEVFEIDDSLEFVKDDNGAFVLDAYGNRIRTDHSDDKEFGSEDVMRYLKDANGVYTENANGIYIKTMKESFVLAVTEDFYSINENGKFVKDENGEYVRRLVDVYKIDESLEYEKDKDGKYVLDKNGNRIRTDFDKNKKPEDDNRTRYLLGNDGEYIEDGNGIYLKTTEYSYVIFTREDDEQNSNGNSKLKLKDRTYNFLVMGCDRGGWLTDVIMIATYDIPGKKLSFMQVPRDTYVFVNDSLIKDEDGNIGFENFDGENGDKSMKINAVAWHGGLIAANELSRISKLANKEDANIKAICKESFLDITESELKEYLAATGSKKKNLEYNIKLEFGIEYLSALLARTFATPIDYYAHMNLNGFTNIVNAIDGVDVYVPQDMDYEDPLQNPPLIIHLKKGQQHLDGKKAEQFIRFRYGYATADIARIDAQKIFMTAFIKKVFSLDGLMNIDTLVEEISGHLTTDVSLENAIHFATNALDLNFSEIVMLTAPGEPKYVGNVSYYCLDKTTLMDYVNKYHNKYTKDLDADYFCVAGDATRNTSTTPLTADDINHKQPNLGFMY